MKALMHRESLPHPLAQLWQHPLLHVHSHFVVISLTSLADVAYGMVVLLVSLYDTGLGVPLSSNSASPGSSLLQDSLSLAAALGEAP